MERVYRRANTHMNKAAPYLASHRSRAEHYRNGKLAYSRVTQDAEGNETTENSDEPCAEGESCVEIVCTQDEESGEEICLAVVD